MPEKISQMYDLLNEYDIHIEEEKDLNVANYYIVVYILKNKQIVEEKYGIGLNVMSDPKLNYLIADTIRQKIKEIKN